MHADANYQGIDKREELQHHNVEWKVALRPGKRRALLGNPMSQTIRKLEEIKTRIRAKVAPLFQVIKLQFGYAKVPNRGLAKNIAQLQTLFALSNLWLVRRKLLTAG